ncbi:MAG: formylglycine-generating enzyme family protein, partial [Microcoleus sp.]
MSENPKEPREYDAVLGGQNTTPPDAAVLGGIAGVKSRLASPVVEARIAALSAALKYGEAGLDLIIQALQDESIQVELAAYSLLKEHPEEKVKQHLVNHSSIFEFDVVTVDLNGRENSRTKSWARFFAEDLGNGISLEMVYIPGGTFMMGEPQGEYPNYSKNKPQHQVSVKPFCLGKYPITQAQWQAVANLPKIHYDLKSNPSYFKREGENRPVERVSWYDTVEFCARLSQKTGNSYRLPSEAEWEYACRAGTTTRFHFGETITTDLATDLANYNSPRNKT